MLLEAERTAVCEFAVRMWKAGHVVGSAGNVSLRPSVADRYVITPSSVPYEAMTPEDVVVVDGEGETIEGERAPSFETPMHLAILKARPDVGAVFHTHSRYATALAVVRKSIPPVVDEMVVYVGGPIEVAPYGASGSDELAAAAVQALGDKAAILLANHGALCVGKDLAKAYKVCELVEHLAMVYCTALTIGTPLELPADVVETELDMYQVVRTM
jgi:L-fuculose-phosphate aldolase